MLVGSEKRWLPSADFLDTDTIAQLQTVTWVLLLRLNYKSQVGNGQGWHFDIFQEEEKTWLEWKSISFHKSLHTIPNLFVCFFLFWDKGLFSLKGLFKQVACFSSYNTIRAVHNCICYCICESQLHGDVKQKI